MQISQAREQYINWLAARELSPHTIRAYGGDVIAFERYLGGHAHVGTIVAERVAEFIAAERERGLSAMSTRRRAAGLRGFCRWLVSRTLLETDPWISTTFAAARTRRLPRVLSGHDLDRLVRSLEGSAQIHVLGQRSVLQRPHESTTLLAVALILTTGVRVHEVVTIECGGIDLTGRTIRLLGKGRRERQVFLTNDWITQLTSAYLSARAARDVEHPFLLFNTHGAPLTTAAMRSRLVKAGEAAGLRAHVTPHMLRHTAATQLIESNVDIRYIQRLLGHASLSTTEIYTHVSNQALRRVVSDADVLGRFVHAR